MSFTVNVFTWLPSSFSNMKSNVISRGNSQLRLGSSNVLGQIAFKNKRMFWKILETQSLNCNLLLSLDLNKMQRSCKQISIMLQSLWLPLDINILMIFSNIVVTKSFFEPEPPDLDATIVFKHDGNSFAHLKIVVSAILNYDLSSASIVGLLSMILTVLSNFFITACNMDLVVCNALECIF